MTTAPSPRGAPSPPSPRPPSDLGRFAGLGLQFALTMAVLGALGFWADSALGTLPWLLVTGVLVGAVGGFVRIVKAVPGSPPRKERAE
ncbi:MAG: AtpZ/AtpI family protein [Planctomycetes bacterium]|nr:AtpZ/AtpI family protein [Planctomycetota bacterium]